LIRILSIASLPRSTRQRDGGGPPVRPDACFYWKGRRHSSWRLWLPGHLIEMRNCPPIPSSLLFFAPEQVVAQSLSQPLFAGHPLGALR
jgi:hypothetical protein